MKNYLLLLSIGAFFTVSCKTTDKTNPYFVSSNAHSLIDSYRDLVAKAPNTGLSHYVKGTYSATRRCTGSSMPNKGYQSIILPGYTTYTSFHFFEINDTNNPTQTYKSSTAAFRTAWHTQIQVSNLFGSLPGDYVPNHIEIIDSLALNTFQALLVPVSAYQSSGLSDSDVTNTADDETTGSLLPLAINSPDIKAINDVYIEPEGEYMSKKLTTKYNDTHSSIGLICEVLLKTGKTEKCYIFNNVDISGTTVLTWKVKKSN